MVSDRVICPVCEAKNSQDSKFCIKCGKNLEETVAYFENKPNDDIEITANKLIVYKRNFFGKRTGEIEVYECERMENIEIGKILKQLRFDYNGKREIYNLKGEYLNKIEEIVLPKIVEKNLSVTPKTGSAPLTIETTCTVKNTGDFPGEYTARLKINSKVVEKDTVSVKAGKSATIRFNHTLNDPGTYNVTINNMAPVSVTVQKPATFKLSNLTVTPMSGPAPLDIIVKVDVTNTGDLEGDYTAQLKVNDQIVDGKTSKVLAGQTVTVTFTKTLTEPGKYNVTINNLTPVEVTVLGPADITIGNLTVTPTSGVAPLDITVSAKLTNIGDVEGNCIAQLKINNQVVDEKTITVPAGKTETVEFTRTLQAGTYNVTINEVSPVAVKVQKEEIEKEESKQEKEEERLIELAKKWGVWTVGHKHDIKALPEVLEDEEEIKRMATGYYDGTGVIVATDRRILFVNKGLLFGIKVESFPYETITSIKHKKGLTMGYIKIYTGGNEAKIDNVLNDEVDAFVKIIRSEIGKSTSQTPSILDEIKKAKELLDIGAITEEEFEKIKNKYLKRI